jgi:FkbM family methyltransferase
MLRCPRAHLGSDYGGWWVRTDLLNAASIVYSCGVGRDITFDLEMIKRFGMQVRAFDPTPRALEWLSSQHVPSEFLLSATGIADYDGVGEFVLRTNPDFDSYELGAPIDGAFDRVDLPVKRIASLMNGFGDDHLDLLKLDIEGAEYRVLADVIDSGIDVRQLLVEFHFRPSVRADLQTVQKTIDRLRQRGFRLFARTPLGYEFSFFRL